MPTRISKDVRVSAGCQMQAPWQSDMLKLALGTCNVTLVELVVQLLQNFCSAFT